jgi:two-component system, NtrC family, sensor histidine kinase HydH
MNGQSGQNVGKSPVKMSRIESSISGILVLLSIVFLVIGVGAAFYVRSLEQSASQLISNSVASTRAARELEIHLLTLRSTLDRYFIDGNQANLESLGPLTEEIEQWLKEAAVTAGTTKEQELIHHAKHGFVRFSTELNRFLKDSPNLEKYGKIRTLIDSILDTDILRPSHEYELLNEELLTRTSKENESLADRLVIVIAGMGLAGGLAGLTIGWLIAALTRRSMVRSQEALFEVAQDLRRAAGAVRLDLPDADLDASLRSMTESVLAVKNTLERTRQDALRAEQLATVGQMAAGIAHEVRNPLMAMKVLVQRAVEDEGKPLDRRSIRILDEEIARVERIVSGFLDFARPPKLQRRTVSLVNLIEQTILGLEPQAQMQGVVITLDKILDDQWVEIDSDQFQQLLYNLIINAIEAQPNGGVVNIRILRDSESNRFEVCDEGIGFREDIVDRIFDPFVSTKESGMGLGLSICRRIVEAHGGTIVARNRESHGACFGISWPKSFINLSDIPPRSTFA